jgi:hypothetical protein
VSSSIEHIVVTMSLGIAQHDTFSDMGTPCSTRISFARWLVTFCSVALALGPSCSSTTTTTGVNDSGPGGHLSTDAFRAPDAFVAACVGVATPCSDRNQSSCNEPAGGCLWTACTGIPDPCDDLFCTSRGCMRDPFDNSCRGTPVPCEMIENGRVCRNQGCTYEATPRCRGTAQPCESHSTADCESYAGCVLPGEMPVDAGVVDAFVAPRDAFVAPDAGPVCTMGSHLCHGACVSNTDVATCGTACTPCPPPPAHADASCDGATCGFACSAGYHLCSGACVSNGDVATCGSACTPCPAPPAHASVSCDASNCGFVCDVGWVSDGSGCVVAPPRPIAPLSSATVTSRRPTLHWVLAPGTDGAHVEICRDRACSTIVDTIDVSGSSAAPATDLPIGVVYWRLASRTGGTVSAAHGPTWQFVVGARSVAVDTAWGTILDVNGDGYSDVAVGAPRTVVGVHYVGWVGVYLGSATGIATSPSTTLSGPEFSDSYFGLSVSSAGDVNGDGFADLAVGATGPGRAFVYLGGPSGLASSPATTLAGSGASAEWRVASAGDVNGDGYGDLAIGDPSSNHVYLHLGGPSGISPSGTTLSGAGGGFYGVSLASGDMNGDGYSDLAVGDNAARGGFGAVYVYLGGAGGLATPPAAELDGPAGPRGEFGDRIASAGDVNGDGYADLVVGALLFDSAYFYFGGPSGLASTPVIITRDPSAPSGFGSAVATAGDVDGDGYGDVAIGSSSPERVDVYLGGPSGPRSAPATSLTCPDGPDVYFGSAIASAGDFDADGHADLAVGAYRWNRSTGRVYVYGGGPTGVTSAPITTWDGPNGTYSRFGDWVAGAR